MRPPRASFLGNQPQQAALLEGRLRLIKRRPGQAELGRGFGHAATLHKHLAQHLVFHLHKVGRVEELTGPEQLMANRLRVRIQAAMLTQRFRLT